ncbi:MAG: ribonuclease H-like domain-containing protein [Candidatus Diapherotrites archaeon]|nr:ribonuclease H-like domain-containing protein [Candidatus Diapherotrites archaeon]
MTEKNIYIDIETTGLSKKSDQITVVGAFNGENFTQLVAGHNLCLENLQKLFENPSRIVSFNGKRFDLPFITRHFSELEIDCREHCDLMELGWALGLSGGLKSLEVQLGLSRQSGVSNGLEAVLLWNDFKSNGNEESLTKLLEYNREDVMNLVTLEKVLKNMALERNENGF